MAETVELCYLDSDNRVAAKRFAASEEFGAVVRLLRLDKAGARLKILDLGCGNGIVSFAFAQLGHDVYGVDPDTSEDVGLGAAARLAAVSAPGSITLKQAFAESLPFPDSYFDAVYTRQAVHHFQDLGLGLRECARVLKSSGEFLATREHVVDDERQLQEFLANHLLHKLHGGENAHSLSRYKDSLTAAGLDITMCLGPHDSVINHFPTSNAQTRHHVYEGLRQRTGSFLATALMKVPLVERMGRAYLSRQDRTPGRMYSFLCSKQTR
jgi:SAM-dependent methyltransferase